MRQGGIKGFSIAVNPGAFGQYRVIKAVVRQLRRQRRPQQPLAALAHFAAGPGQAARGQDCATRRYSMPILRTRRSRSPRMGCGQSVRLETRPWAHNWPCRQRGHGEGHIAALIQPTQRYRSPTVTTWYRSSPDTVFDTPCQTSRSRPAQPASPIRAMVRNSLSRLISTGVTNPWR